MATQHPDDRSDGPWSDKNKRKFRNKDLSEFYDPCQEAAARSIQCLNRNGGDRTMCQDYFALAEKEKSTTSRKTPSLEVNKIKGNNDSTLRENYANYISRPSAVHMRCQPTQWRLATNNLVFT
ncbi:hypothetical protein OOU_Y34scaffold00767g16 [Pyricularia oryzae Y34]|nr:hypothetical protein OOU_Y34scaffold00767g16 [Pyricularia oryzae Y34]